MIPMQETKTIVLILNSPPKQRTTHWDIEGRNQVSIFEKTVFWKSWWNLIENNSGTSRYWRFRVRNGNDCFLIYYSPWRKLRLIANLAEENESVATEKVEFKSGHQSVFRAHFGNFELSKFGPKILNKRTSTEISSLKAKFLIETLMEENMHVTPRNLILIIHTRQCQ